MYNIHTMAEYHKMKAWLYDSVLTGNPDDYTARIHSEASLGIDDVSKSAVERGGADVSASAMTHAVNLWLKEMAYRSCDGFSINTGWFTVQPVVRGIFNSPAEKFSPAKHTVVFDFRQGSLMRKELAGVEVDVLGAAPSAISIAQVTDVKTGSINDLLTPGRNLIISGSKLKIAGDHADNGIRFINRENGETVKVPENDIVKNLPTELIIVIPELADGTYLIELTTQSGSGGNPKQLLKNPRTAAFDKILTVEA